MKYDYNYPGENWNEAQPPYKTRLLYWAIKY